MSVTNAIEGGYDTARISAAESDQIARRAALALALAYLDRTGNADVAEILGLVDAPKPKRGRTVRGEVRKPKESRC